MKTLIVDDDILNCKLLQSILKDHGECVIAMSGETSIQIFEEALKKQEPFDLVCLDIMMPEKDGYDVLRAIRRFEQDFAQDKNCRIVMVTALDEQECKAKAFFENCDGYLVKPIEQKLLFEMLNKMNLLPSN